MNHVNSGENSTENLGSSMTGLNPTTNLMFNSNMKGNQENSLKNAVNFINSNISGTHEEEIMSEETRNVFSIGENNLQGEEQITNLIEEESFKEDYQAPHLVQSQKDRIASAI